MITAFILALVAPYLTDLRDKAYYSPLPQLEPSASNRLKQQGFVSVVHAEETLSRVSDERGRVSSTPLHLYYASTYDAVSCTSHVVLIHGTGDNANGWFETVRDNPSLTSSKGFESESIVDRFHDAGHCVSSPPMYCGQCLIMVSCTTSCASMTLRTVHCVRCSPAPHSSHRNDACFDQQTRPIIL